MWIWFIIPLLILCHVVGFDFGGGGGKALCVCVCWESEGVLVVGVALKESQVYCVGFGVHDKQMLIIISTWNKWCHDEYTLATK